MRVEWNLISINSPWGPDSNRIETEHQAKFPSWAKNEVETGVKFSFLINNVIYFIHFRLKEYNQQGIAPVIWYYQWNIAPCAEEPLRQEPTFGPKEDPPIRRICDLMTQLNRSKSEGYELLAVHQYKQWNNNRIRWFMMLLLISLYGRINKLITLYIGKFDYPIKGSRILCENGCLFL